MQSPFEHGRLLLLKSSISWLLRGSKALWESDIISLATEGFLKNLNF